MKIEILQQGQAVPTDADLVFVDARHFGGFFVVKNKRGSMGFLLPENYLGYFIVNPESVPHFTMSSPALTAGNITPPTVQETDQAVPIARSVDLVSSSAAPTRPPV